MDTTASNSGNFAVGEDHRPVDTQEYRARALFLTAGLGILCSRMLKEYMDHCEVGPSGRAVDPPITMDEYSLSVKELLSISVWLTLFEQLNHELPDWFKSFMLECHAVGDKVQPKPTSKEVEAKYNLNSPIPEICMEVGINLCSQLRLGATANDAMLYLGDILLRSKKFRNELLEFGLTQPIAALDERIKSG